MNSMPKAYLNSRFRLVPYGRKDPSEANHRRNAFYTLRNGWGNDGSFSFQDTISLIQFQGLSLPQWIEEAEKRHSQVLANPSSSCATPFPKAVTQTQWNDGLSLSPPLSDFPDWIADVSEPAIRVLTRHQSHGHLDVLKWRSPRLKWSLVNAK